MNRRRMINRKGSEIEGESNEKEDEKKQQKY